MRSGAPTPDPSAPAILCPRCGDRVPLEAGEGRPGSMIWTCRERHAFGKRVPRPTAFVERLRLLPI